MNAPIAQVSCDAIDALLPQTQCRQCGYPGCRPYAEAISTGRAEIDQCPPGGEDVIRDLAAVLGLPFKPLNPQFGVTRPAAVAVIDEQTCIGCTLCIQACPVDAIVGAAKLMHTVIAQECTGCALCMPPCPVDCISLRETGIARSREQRKNVAALAHRRFESRNRRLAQVGRQAVKALETTRRSGCGSMADEEKKRAAIAKAVARARSRLQQDGR
ncbi:MAG: RnfABCDGE type electron transport complex subunit B [Pseudomonadota bacterium]